MSRKTFPLPYPLFSILDDPEAVLARDLCAVLRTLTRGGLSCGPAVAWHGTASVVTIVKCDESPYYWLDNASGMIRHFLHELEDWDYPDPIPLASDIANCGDEQMLRIWNDPLARACWVCLRWRRLTNQYFKDAVEWFAEWVKARRAKGTLTRAALRAQLSSMHEVMGTSEKCGIYAHRMYPYLSGEKEFRFVVEQKEAAGGA